jgi:hypothetical protein
VNGGKGGGGTGGIAVNFAGSGTANTGGGGGGGGYGGGNGYPGDGGSGVVILRYTSAYSLTIGAGLTHTTVTEGTDKVTIFKSGSDSISWSAA